MKIGLSGAPGAGKSDLAHSLAERLGDTVVIDGYVEEIEQEISMAMSYFAGYLGNLFVALGRYGRERSAQGDHSITCGTLLETAVYTATKFASMDEVLSDEEKQEMLPRVDATLRILSCFYMDIFAYDHVFYLPARRSADTETLFIDKQLQAAIGAFNLCPITILEDPATRVEDAMKVLEDSEVQAA